ncbi:hypothetical protein StDouc24_02725 [Streptococcus thermophilus]|uniref:hypothetical protein n=1 Tax=Streptococcus thermophilus TaxID=1308 RepID=UPI001C646FEE|nr:hypothetical protein [Streptococcus thermophilus]MBW7797497.1 hypothetical protein [Streptococcus thermophilus]
MTEAIKIIRGTYLTGAGQEPSAYYFKVPESHMAFEMIGAGDVVLTFYQNRETITSLPALVRVDGVITAEREVEAFLQGEKRDHFPMLPIVTIFDEFDPLVFKKIMDDFSTLKQELKRLAKVKVIQGNLFEFLDEEDD